MNHSHQSDSSESHHSSPLHSDNQKLDAPSYPRLTLSSTNAWVAFVVVVLTILFYLWTHHKTHLLDVLPYLLILAMALMHIFMHGGHGNHRTGDKHHE